MSDRSERVTIPDGRNDPEKTSTTIFGVISSCGIVPIRAKKRQGIVKARLAHKHHCIETCCTSIVAPKPSSICSIRIATLSQNMRWFAAQLSNMTSSSTHCPIIVQHVAYITFMEVSTALGTCLDASISPQFLDCASSCCASSSSPSSPNRCRCLASYTPPDPCRNYCSNSKSCPSTPTGLFR
jgi:hypothetical protein